MVTYKAAFKFLPDGVHAQLVDFPAVISCGASLAEARTNLGLALVDLAEYHLDNGEPLPAPNSLGSDPEADVEEPLYLWTSQGSKDHVGYP